jgi:cystathionine beta-lyase/cystathionine gamma-synthase
LELNYDGCIENKVKTKPEPSQLQYQHQQEHGYVQKPISQTSTFVQKPVVERKTTFTQTQNQHISGQHQHSVAETKTKFANCKPPSAYQILDLEWVS